MPTTMTVTEAAARFHASTRTVRRILQLDTAAGREKAHAGYDASGRTLLSTEVVEEKAREREMRGNWRIKNLKHWALPRTTRRDAPGGGVRSKRMKARKDKPRS